MLEHWTVKRWLPAYGVKWGVLRGDEDSRIGILQGIWVGSWQGVHVILEWGQDVKEMAAEQGTPSYARAGTVNV